LGYECNERNLIKHKFNTFSKLAGKDWVNGFMKINPEFSLRKLEVTSINRILAFNEDEVKQFLSNLESVMKK
jgi:hypothetical protein